MKEIYNVLKINDKKGNGFIFINYVKNYNVRYFFDLRQSKRLRFLKSLATKFRKVNKNVLLYLFFSIVIFTF